MTPTSANPGTAFCLATVTGSRAGPGAKLSNQSSSQDVSTRWMRSREVARHPAMHRMAPTARSNWTLEQ